MLVKRRNISSVIPMSVKKSRIFTRECSILFEKSQFYSKNRNFIWKIAILFEKSQFYSKNCNFIREIEISKVVKARQKSKLFAKNPNVDKNLGKSLFVLILKML